MKHRNPEREPEDKIETTFDALRRKAKKPLIAAAAAIGIGTAAAEFKKSYEGGGSLHQHEFLAKDAVKTHFDDEKDFSRQFPNGELMPKERARRTVKLKNGETILHDVGLDFYRVQKGDSIEAVKKRLARYPSWKYLLELTEKTESFNIPAKDLREGMWVPIPPPKEERGLEAVELLRYAHEALTELEQHPRYGAALKALQKEVGEDELLALMLATARQESGTKRIGELAPFRYERHYKAFSYSIYHVLMSGVGLKARRELQLTEGQLIHPKNGSKLFLAYLVERMVDMRKHPSLLKKFFPIEKHLDDFASFYNGAHYKKTNPHYVPNMARYYPAAEELVDMVFETGMGPIAKPSKIAKAERE